MKTRKVVSCSLLSLAVFQAMAIELPKPLYTSLLTAEQSQIQTRDPVQLTKTTEVQQSIESLANKIVVRDNHVVMIAEMGATILERTAKGLVRRQELEFDLDKFRGTSQIFASADGKDLLWFYGSTLVQLTVNADFTASVKTQSTSISCYNIYPSEKPDEFVCYDGQTSKYKALQVTSQGLVTIAELPATNELLSSRLYYNSKDKVLVSSATGWDVRQFIVFKPQNGQFVETGRYKDEANSWYSQSGVYDIDTGRLLVSSYYSNSLEVKVNAQTGAIDAVNEINSTVIDGQSGGDFAAVVSGNFFVARGYNGDYLVQRDGNKFRNVTASGNSSESMISHFKNAAGKDELWQNTKWSLKRFELTNQDWLLQETRGSAERGLPKIEGGAGVSSDDHRFLAHSTGADVAIIALDKNKQLQSVFEYSASQPATQGLPYNAKFLKVQNGKYLIAGSDNYRVLTEDANGKFAVTAAKPLPQPIGYLYDNSTLKIKDELIYVAQNGLKVLQLKNDELVVATTLKDTALDQNELNSIRSIVELKGQLYALMPSYGKTAQLSYKDGQLKVASIGTMPKGVQGNFAEGMNRVFIEGSPSAVLMPDADNNLRVSAFSFEYLDGYLYQKRLKIARNLYPQQNFVLLNDDITGIWQSVSSSGDCCENYSATRILSGHLVTFDNNQRQKVTTFALNTAPYMPAQINPLQFNQGVEAEIPLSGFVRDEEQQTLTYSGLTNEAFSLLDGAKLKFKGLATGSGDLLLTVTDGGLLSDLKLPYQINAAPKVLRPLPVIIANQNGLLQFDFNDYIEDPEGSAISFVPQSQQGFSLSKSGMLSGTATALADVSLPLQITDKNGAVLKTTATIKVNAAPALTGSNSGSGKVNQSFALDLNTVITDAEKHRVTLTAQGLPAGLSLNGAVISGTPTAAGSATVSITATDELGARSQLSLSLNIAAEDKKGGGSVGFGLLALLAFVRGRRSWC